VTPGGRPVVARATLSEPERRRYPAGAPSTCDDHLVELSMPNANPPARAATVPQPAWRRRIEGDVHVGTMAADVRLVPGTGSGKVKGEKAITDVMHDVLDRVRRSIRERSGRRR
jgi:hypothetical protein